jgi:hypothetical protein
VVGLSALVDSKPFWETGVRGRLGVQLVLAGRPPYAIAPVAAVSYRFATFLSAELEYTYQDRDHFAVVLLGFDPVLWYASHFLDPGR